jgi:hypothetical protein
MKVPVRRILLSAALAVVALVLAVVALVVLPCYGAIMVIWMHVPLTSILATLGPISGLLAVGAYFAFRACGRMRKGVHEARDIAV